MWGEVKFARWQHVTYLIDNWHYISYHLIQINKNKRLKIYHITLLTKFVNFYYWFCYLFLSLFKLFLFSYFCLKKSILAFYDFLISYKKYFVVTIYYLLFFAICYLLFFAMLFIITICYLLCYAFLLHFFSL